MTTRRLQDTLGEVVHETIVDRRLKMQDVARELGITRNSLFRRTAGHVAFTVEELTVVARLTGTTPGALIAQAEGRR